jgi:hypothetical protein
MSKDVRSVTVRRWRGRGDLDDRDQQRETDSVVLAGDRFT